MVNKLWTGVEYRFDGKKIPFLGAEFREKLSKLSSQPERHGRQSARPAAKRKPIPGPVERVEKMTRNPIERAIG